MERDFDDSDRQSFGWTMRDVFRLLQRAWNRRLRDTSTGLSPAQSQILGALEAVNGVTQTELAEEVGMEKAPLGRHLDRLESLGLIERHPDPADRRVRRVYYSDAAKCMEPELWEAAYDLFEVALAGLSARERRQLMALLDRMKQNLLDADTQAELAAGAKSRGAAS